MLPVQVQQVISNFETCVKILTVNLIERMNENLQFLANSRMHLKEFQLYHQQLKEKYGENIPPEILKDLSSELKRLREKYSKEANKVNPRKGNFL